MNIKVYNCFFWLCQHLSTIHRHLRPCHQLTILIMKTRNYFIEALINKDVVDNKTTETVTLKDCLSTSPTTQQIQTSVSAPIQFSTTFSMPDNLHREDARHKTFTNWPHSFIDAKILALTGFYYIGPIDNVKCYFCKVEIGRWEPEDNEVTEHSRWSPNCALIRRRETNNVPINEGELSALLPQQTYDVCGPYGTIEVRQGSYAESSFTVPPNNSSSSSSSSNSGSGGGSLLQQQQQQSSIPTVPSSTATILQSSSMRSPDHPEYAIESARLRSFDDWPKTMKQSPKDLSDAGFFYTQTGDRVKCFSCGGGLRDWDENDVPWEQHALWFSRCEYLKLIKGQTYIDAVMANKKQQDTVSLGQQTNSKSIGNQSESNSLNSDAVPTMAARNNVENSCTTNGQLPVEDSVSEKKICESRLCKICYSCEYNTAFFPCGHVVACAKCASAVTKCPMCRKRFEHVIRVYFS